MSTAAADSGQLSPSSTVRIADVIAFLESNNFSSVSQSLKKHFSWKDSTPSHLHHSAPVDWCNDEYTVFVDIIQGALDAMKVELSSLLFPIFCYFYFELIKNDNIEGATSFFNRFVQHQFSFHSTDCNELISIKSKEQLLQSSLARSLTGEKYAVTMSSETHIYLMKHLNERSLVNLTSIFKSKLNVVVYNAKTRSSEVIESSLGSFGGDATHSTAPIKMFYGVNKEFDPYVDDDDDNETPESGKKPRKRLRKELAAASKKPKITPMAPPLDRVPLPEVRDLEKIDKSLTSQDIKRVKVGLGRPICAYCYTLHNTTNSLASLSISDDSTLLAAGFESSIVKIWSLTDQPLKEMKSYQELSTLDLEDDSLTITLDSLLDDKTATESKTMAGHRGTVSGCSFAPDKSSILTSSTDSTIRLWSLYTFSNLVIFKGHLGPVWDVQFANHGHYFASAGDDKSVRLWTQEHIQPLRVFVDHLSPVECLCYHPNSNYILSGSSDRTVRVWDVLLGECVRILTGHKSPITCIVVHPATGRFVVSGNENGKILVHDLSFSNQTIAVFNDELGNDTGPVYSLSFDRNGTVLVAGFGNCCIKLWDVSKLFSSFLETDVPILQSSLNQSPLPDCSAFLMNTFYTKATPVKSVHFTKKNLLLVGGNYQVGSLNLKS